LTDDIDVPEGHYEEVSMQQTVVPNRNMIMLSMAVGYAVSIGAEAVLFVEAMNNVCQIANYEAVDIRAPFIGSSKIDILREGLAQGFDYSETWTCYKGLEKACGKCGSCQERLEAFDLNSAVDPIAYSD
jgi:7-cyano-7-deazaguanine synthase